MQRRGRKRRHKLRSSMFGLQRFYGCCPGRSRTPCEREARKFASPSTLTVFLFYQFEIIVLEPPYHYVNDFANKILFFLSIVQTLLGGFFDSIYVSSRFFIVFSIKPVTRNYAVFFVRNSLFLLFFLPKHESLPSVLWVDALV